MIKSSCARFYTSTVHCTVSVSAAQAARAYVTACSRIGRDPAPARSSALRGVSWSKGRQRWVAQIQVDGKGRHLGLFMDEEAAAKAYRQACRALGRDPGP